MLVVLASNNVGKLAEFKHLFANSEIEIVPQKNFQVPEAVENGLTFIENAIIKARNACKYTKLPAIGDDSGLAVDALNGQPGIYSARFAGKNATQTEHINKLLSVMHDIPPAKRTARFHCILAYMHHTEDPAPLIVHASWEGKILTQAKGENGFGYDPIFFVPQLNCTAAQLAPAIKIAHSHRGKAMCKLLTLMQQNSTITTTCNNV